MLVRGHVVCPHAAVAKDSIDGADRGYGVWVADSLR